MTIADMHIMFRQLAQQMGMQNVRAILPEQIDLLLNTVIIDVVNEIIKRNIAGTNDRVATDNSKIGQINALSTLYHTVDISFQEIFEDNDSYKENGVAKFSKYSTSTIMTKGITSINLDNNLDIDNYMFLVDFAINYNKTNNARTITDYFPIRIIDDIYLSDVLNDFILAPSFRSPVGIISKVNDNKSLTIYLERKRNGNFLTTELGIEPCNLRVSYVSKPANVRYSEDADVENINCDLPDYLHGDIVKRAVDLYHSSLSGSLLSAQAQERAQQQEALRNNYRQGDGSQATQQQ